jgi:hypothetical protein
MTNNFILCPGYQGQQVLAVLPQLIHKVGLYGLPESPFIHLPDCRDIV